MNWVGGTKNRVKDSFSRTKSKSNDKKTQKEFFERQKKRHLSEANMGIGIKSEADKIVPQKAHKKESQDIAVFNLRTSNKSKLSLFGKQMQIRSIDLGEKTRKENVKPVGPRIQTVEFPLSPTVSSRPSHLDRSPETKDKRTFDCVSGKDCRRSQSKSDLGKPHKSTDQPEFIELFGKSVKLPSKRKSCEITRSFTSNTEGIHFDGNQFYNNPESSMQAAGKCVGERMMGNESLNYEI